jgi:hypothetical protein
MLKIKNPRLRIKKMVTISHSEDKSGSVPLMISSPDNNTGIE